MASFNEFNPPLNSQELVEDKRNGFGYSVFQPENPTSLHDALPNFAQHSDFTEMKPITDALATNRQVLVEGPPGSGKSHLVRDLQTAAIANNVPMFFLATHINGGNRKGVENIKPALEEFRQRAAAAGGGLVILDNVDYVGYKGHSRKGGLATAYAQALEPLVGELTDDPNLAVIATAHDDRWRKAQWSWGREEIDLPARKTLEHFSIHHNFEGKVALVGLAHILHQRNAARGEGAPTSLGEAARVIRMLHHTGRANFFHANHLPVQVYLNDPQAAIQKIEAGREKRYG